VTDNDEKSADDFGQLAASLWPCGVDGFRAMGVSLSEEVFADLAETAKNGCPVSQALAGNVPITLEATLA